MESIILRRQTPEDLPALEHLVREAFWNHYSPGCCEHYLTHILPASAAFVPQLSFVAEVNGHLAGCILYTRAAIRLDRGGEEEVLCFGPIAVLPEDQGKGVGTALIRHTQQIARELGFPAILIYGDPAYYGRTGFVPAETFGIATADDLYADSLQVCELRPGALAQCQGRFEEDPVFAVDPAACEAFDRQFPPKTPLAGGPSQERFASLITRRRPRGK